MERSELRGKDLLEKVAQLKDLPKSDLVRQCGYAKTGKDGKDILNFSGFFDALLEAKGGDPGFCEQQSSDSQATECNVLANGSIEIQLPSEFRRSPVGRYGIRRDEWDSYYPGTPIRVCALDKESTFAYEGDYDPGCFEIITEGDETHIHLEAEWLEKGQRYTIQLEYDYDNWSFWLEPEPWNGLEDANNEPLRLLILPESSVSDLLILCDTGEDSLFDPEEFESLEDALSDSLSRAMKIIESDDAKAYLDIFNYATTDIPGLLEKNWLKNEAIKGFATLRKTLKAIIELQAQTGGRARATS